MRSNPPVIPNLESLYKGVLFRSRLEARWANLFDRLEIRWVYEPEVFETSMGNYLPDFYFPALDTYVEIKPKKQMRIDAVYSVAQQTGSDFLLLRAPVVECRVYSLLHHCPSDKELAWTDMTWCASLKYLIGRNRGENRFYISIGHSNYGADWDKCPFCDGDAGLSDFREARSLRFDNGVAK